MSGQQSFNFPRASQLAALNRVELPRRHICRDGAGVSDTATGAVLRAIDSHARERSWCFAKIATLAAEARVGVRTAKRAIEALRALSLLIDDPDGGGVGQRLRLRICWPNVIGEDGPPECHGGTAPSAMVAPPECHGDRPECHGGTAIRNDPKTTNKRRIETTVDRREIKKGKTAGQAGDFFDGIDADDWRTLARSIRATVDVRDDRDRQLIGKVARLVVAGQIPEAAVAEAVESVAIKRAELDRPAAWFLTCLKNYVVARGGAPGQVGGLLIATPELPPARVTA